MQNLKLAREKAGLTQRDVEAKLELRKLMIRDYEMGRLKLPVTVAIDLAKLYGVSLYQLLGLEEMVEESSALDNFKTLFHASGFETMFMDPVIRAELGEPGGEYFSHSIFDLLTTELSQNQKEELVVEIARFLNSLAGADGKIKKSERECVNNLLQSFGLGSKVKSVSHMVGEVYLPTKLIKSFTRLGVKHFVVWLMFFFAGADEEIDFQEVAYIERVAELLKLNRTNFLEIKGHFIKENL